MKAWLLQQGYLVSRKRVRRLMRLMGLEAIYRRPNTSKPAPGHRIFPYLLKGVEVNRVDQVWAADITYIPMAKGFLYLVAIMDWHSRHVLAWKLSNTMGAGFCVAALEEALGKGRPEIFNTDQGSQFTSEAFTQTLQEQRVQVSMAPWDGTRRPCCSRRRNEAFSMTAGSVAVRGANEHHLDWSHNLALPCLVGEGRARTCSSGRNPARYGCIRSLDSRCYRSTQSQTS